MENNEQKVGDIINSFASRVNVVDGKVDFEDIKDAFWLIFKEYNSHIKDEFSNYAEKKSTIKTALDNIEKDINELQNNVELKAEKQKLTEIETILNTNLAKKYNVFILVSYVAAFLSIIAICSSFIFKDVVIVKESIVLIFVGILATFIVVGNHLQIINAEARFKEKINEIKMELSGIDEKIDKKIERTKPLNIEIVSEKTIEKVIKALEQQKHPSGATK